MQRRERRAAQSVAIAGPGVRTQRDPCRACRDRRRDFGRTASVEDARSGRSAWPGRPAEHRRHRGGLLDAAPYAATRLDQGTQPAAPERKLLKTELHPKSVWDENKGDERVELGG